MLLHIHSNKTGIYCKRIVSSNYIKAELKQLMPYAVTPVRLLSVSGLSFDLDVLMKSR